MLTAPLLLGATCSTRIHERTWIEARTPNFTIWSCARESVTLELARELELFRAVVEFVVGDELPSSPVPTHVYAFPTPLTYRPFAIPGAAGHFEQSMRENTIVIAGRAASHVDSTELIQHEYVHFLLQNHGDFIYPKWYHEGFAEFLASVRLVKDQIEVGGVPSRGVPSFDVWIPTEKLMGLEVGTRISEPQLYAQSWALVHYLTFGREGAGDTRRQLTGYLRAIAKGRPVDEAVETGFGIGVAELDDALRRYVRRGRYPSILVWADRFPAVGPPRLRALSPGEAATALGELSLKRERHAQALRYFGEALLLDPDDVRARVGSAAAHEGLGRLEQAEAGYRGAVELAPDDALAQLALANYLAARASEAVEAEGRAELAVRARSHYVKSWKLDDSIPETYARYGSTFLLPGEDPQRGLDTLQHAYRMLPSSTEIRLDLARLHLALGNSREARRLALSTSATLHGREQQRLIDTILERTRSASEG